MQTMRSPGTAKSDYFRQRAETLRQQLLDQEVLLIRRKAEVDWFLERERAVPKEFADRLAHSERQVRETKLKMQQALYIAGRP